MARTPDQQLAPLRRGILARIFETEVCLEWTRGATVSELCEWFANLDGDANVRRGRIAGQVRTLTRAGFLEKRQREFPPPTTFYCTTEAGRIELMESKRLGLQLVPAASINNGLAPHEPWESTE